MPPKKKSDQYDLNSYLGRSQYVNSTIDSKTAKKRQNAFKDLAGPVSGAAMLGTTVAGAALGAPFMPFVAPIAGLAYVASRGKARSERKESNAKASAAAVKRNRPKPVTTSSSRASAAVKRTRPVPTGQMKAK
jgi:hypothetical protein